MVDHGLRYQMYMLCPVQYPLPRFLWFFFQVYGRTVADGAHFG